MLLFEAGISLIPAANNNISNISTYRKTIKTMKQEWDEKLLYGYFRRQTSYITHEKTWTWLQKGNLKRETESQLIAVQNNAIRTSYVKAQIDRTQQNSKFWLYKEKDATVNH